MKFSRVKMAVLTRSEHRATRAAFTVSFNELEKVENKIRDMALACKLFFNLNVDKDLN